MFNMDLLLPTDLGLFQFIGLIILSMFTSMITVVAGVGGGATLLVFMANMLPTAAIIPVHGAVQLGSNAGRLLLMRHFICWRMVSSFVVGCLLGSLLGAKVVISLPEGLLKLVLGGFILFSCWIPIKLSFQSRKSGLMFGAVTAFLTMFIGATGVFIVNTLKNALNERRELVATSAALMVWQHAIKAVMFGLFGFAFHDWLGLIVLMIAFGLLGTFIGKQLLEKIPNERFGEILKWVITVLALKLVWDGMQGVM